MAENLLKVGFRYDIFIYALRYAELGLCKRQLRIIELSDGTAAYIVGLGGDIVCFLCGFHSFLCCRIALHLGLHRIEILTDGYLELTFGIIDLDGIELGKVIHSEAWTFAWRTSLWRLPPEKIGILRLRPT